MKTRVLQLVDSFNVGGGEVQAAQLIRMLHESSCYEVHVACLNPAGVLRSEVERIGIRDIPAYPLASFYDRNALMQISKFARHLREKRIDVVQTHDFYTNVFGMAAARLAATPARIAAKRETGSRSPMQNRVERAAYRLSTTIVVNAEAVRQLLVSQGVPDGKIFTNHNGLNLDRLVPRMSREEALATFGLPAEAPDRRHSFVTIVANLKHAFKDHPMFLRAAGRVRQAVPQARFILAGEGGLIGEMRDLSHRLGVGGDVYFIGRCNEIADLLAISDVCVLSSQAEGFSNSIIEYMGASRPVVATDVGGAREAIIEGQTGYLVRPGDDEKMASHIIDLLLDPILARTLGKKGRRIVEKKFSLKAQLERTEQLYGKLLMRTRTRKSENISLMKENARISQE